MIGGELTWGSGSQREDTRRVNAGGTAGELLNRLKAEELHDGRSNEGNSRTTELRQ
jgi:hypothetical protein